MKRDKTKHICILVDCLTGGGAEKVASLLSKSFSDENYKVSIISTLNRTVDYDYKGQLYNLGVINNRFRIIKTLKKFFVFKKTYKAINADIYIDFRFRNNVYKELILHLFVFNVKKTIFTIHLYRVNDYIPKSMLLYKTYNRAKAVVAVSEVIMEATKTLYNFSNLLYIPNFYNNEIIVKSEKPLNVSNTPFIIAVGRLKNEVKQFDKLILAYKTSLPAKNNIPLYILGEGKDKDALIALVKENDSEDLVKIMGFKSNPYPYVKASQFLILSSKIEGMPMVLVEALALGTPVVAFNCKSGPSEIIEHQENGLLVKDQDFQALTEAINRMYNDKEFYLACKKNSKSSIYKYSNEVVLKKWLQLIENTKQL